MSRGSSKGAILRWRIVDASAGDWRVLEPAPEANRGFNELRRYVFECSSPGCSLHIDDEPLQVLSGKSWEWHPGFFAGEVTAELKGPDGLWERLYLLDVAPDSEKLGQQFFAEMVTELWDEDPTLVIGDEPAKTTIGELGLLEDPWLAFARMRRYLPEFLRALVPVCQSPRRTLHVARDSAPLHNARRVDQRTAMSVLRSPAIAMLFSQPDDAPAIAPGSRIDVPIVHETVDAAANRAILALALALLRRTQFLLDRLGSIIQREVISETRTPLAVRWPARKESLEDMELQLARVLRRLPFTEVRRPEVTAAGLTAISADPIYSRAWGRGWRALRNGVESEPSAERLWISPSWEIYERWCFLRLGKVLALGIPRWKWTLSRNPRRWIGIGPDGQAELLLQPTFGAASTRKEGMWSISRERVPDLVLIVRRSGNTRFLVVDAKYRTSRPNVLEAMESAHIYQDSLRIGSSRPEASLLAVPCARHAAWLAEPQFLAEHRVGIFSLSSAEQDSLPDVIMTAFDS